MSVYYRRKIIEGKCSSQMRKTIIKEMKQDLPSNAIVVYEDFNATSANDIILIYTLNRA